MSSETPPPAETAETVAVSPPQPVAEVGAQPSRPSRTTAVFLGLAIGSAVVTLGILIAFPMDQGLMDEAAALGITTLAPFGGGPRAAAIQQLLGPAFAQLTVFLIVAITSLVAVVLAIWTMVSKRDKPDPKGRLVGAAGALMGVANLLLLFGIAIPSRWQAFIYGVSASLTMGRPLRVGGRVVSAQAVQGSGWQAGLRVKVVDLDREVRGRLADEWLREARTEHASIAAFSRLSLDLLSVGAPPHLLEAIHRAALDEVRHAMMCFSMASSYAGSEYTAGPLPEAAAPLESSRCPGRQSVLARVAMESILDGCFNEKLQSAMAREGATSAADGALRAALEVFAEDEDRHGELAWHIVEWCLRQGGDEVTRAVRRALRDMGARGSPPPGTRPGSDGSLAAHGRLGDVRLQELYRSVRESLLRRGQNTLALAGIHDPSQMVAS